VGTSSQLPIEAWLQTVGEALTHPHPSRVAVLRLRKALCWTIALVIITAVLWRRTPRQIEPSSAATLGVASAPVVLVYYTDYRCASCRTFALQILPKLRTRFVETGALRILVKDVAISPESAAISNAARCAGEFGKYWAFHDSVLAVRGAVPSPQALQRIAADIGVPNDPFARCLTHRRHATEIEAETRRARQLGVRALPAFVLAGRDGRMTPSSVIDGVATAETFDAMIDRRLRH
jgi:protein-disulfide isomerase